MIIFAGYTHIAVTVTLYLLLFPFNLINITLVAIASILPDIDTPYSLLGRFNLFSCVTHHRGFCHTIQFILVVLALTWITPIPYIPILFGLFAHLILDTLNPKGIMWLYPFSHKHYSLKVCKTGSPEEIMIFGICLLYLFTKYKIK